MFNDEANDPLLGNFCVFMHSPMRIYDRNSILFQLKVIWFKEEKMVTY